MFENVLQTTEVYRPFPGSKNPRFQNEAKNKTFLMKMNFICRRIKLIFMAMASHDNGLALKQRLVASLK